MSRVAKETAQERLEELKKEVNTAEYIETAVERISWVLSSEISEMQGKNERRQG
ncbi:MAG: hypothetical protein IK040_07220 [Spirochaetia bacterium]|nr:hypothetical protein [Spirochaetia bacterium]MBR4437119.1 hypothetical protein [Spirochaetales bacterium]MBR4797474.1 hypothetical protein [Spirochaetia bacterium]MBR5017924.1 hypothetical protein [Spirochaetia bacterium]MBR5928230.1 hypothetical protein [Spirochaetia bacterium]